MKRIPVEAPVKYEVLVGNSILCDVGKYIGEFVEPCKVLLITDDNVGTLYADTVSVSLFNAGYNVCKYVFTSGERTKNIHTLNAILEFAAGNYLKKDDLFIALGGGVVADVTGVAAALYRSGVRHMLIPTSLIAAIDSSAGGESSINLLAGRGLAGIRWHPRLVLCDYSTLKTLPKDVLAEGIVEAIKLGMISDLRLFEQFESGSIAYDLENIISRCINIKRRVLDQDRHESGMAQLLNFGKTFADAIEKYSEHTVSHTSALACGMVLISRVAERLGMTREPCSERLCRAFLRHNIDVSLQYDTKTLLSAILADREPGNGKITVVLPVRPGKCRIAAISIDELCRI